MTLEDPSYLAEQDSERVVREFAREGLTVGSVYDFVNTDASYPRAIPVLIRLLQTVRNARIKEGVIRALTVKEAKGIASNPLLEEFDRISAPPYSTWYADTLRTLIGNALSVVADETVKEGILVRAADPKSGTARVTLLPVLYRYKSDPRVEQILWESLGDPEVDYIAVIELGHIGCVRAREIVARYAAKETDAYWRKRFEASLRRIDRTIARSSKGD